ncbi:MAG: DUF1508 domain-containing protein [Chloroflexota bacterium]
MSKPQVFISYAHDDAEAARRFCQDLKALGVNTWMDEDNMHPGKWKKQITKAITASRYFLFCLSRSTLAKTKDGSGFVDDELQQAYEIAMAQDERQFTIIPVRLEDVGRGDHRLSMYYQYDLFADWQGTVNRLAGYLGGSPAAGSPEDESGTSDDQHLEALSGKAEAAYYSADYSTALTLFTSILEKDDSSPNAWVNQGTALMATGKVEKAIDAYDEALKRDEHNTLAILKKGLALMRVERYPEALDALKQGVAHDADDEVLWSYIGNLYRKTGQSADALDAYATALSINPMYTMALFGKGNALYRLGRTDEAETLFEQGREAFEQQPNSAPGIRNAFVIKQAKNGKYYFDLKDTHRNIILVSQMYFDIRGCENGIASVKMNAVRREMYDEALDAKGNPYFRLKAKNAQIIGMSQRFTSMDEMQDAIETVMLVAPSAKVIQGD